MAVDVCAEIPSPGISPRISFSHDLNTNNNQTAEISEEPRLDSCLLDSDFDFFIAGGTNFQQQLSSADELFSNGTILPVQIHKQKHSHYYSPTGNKAIPLPPPPPPPPDEEPKKNVPKLLKEFLSMSLDGDEDSQSQTPATVSKSVWPQFKRSNSLNSIRSRGGDLIRSLHFLSRSHSTGSAPISSRNQPVSSSKDKPHLRKQRSVPCSNRKSPLIMQTSPNIGGAFHFHPYSSSSSSSPRQQKWNQPHLRKCGSYGNNNGGVRISPVLNIPSPTFISRGTVNLFGSLFCNDVIGCQLDRPSSSM
ncbi:hypothetical protein LINGRAHAP2_LOCUS11170 [Linum grandiflorum]